MTTNIQEKSISDLINELAKTADELLMVAGVLADLDGEIERPKSILEKILEKLERPHEFHFRDDELFGYPYDSTGGTIGSVTTNTTDSGTITHQWTFK